MISIPVIWLISIFSIMLAVIIARKTRMPAYARVSFCTGLGSVALVAGLVGARFQLNDPAFIAVQPYLAVVTAPAFWFGFRMLTTQDGPAEKNVIVFPITVVIAAWAFISLPFPWTASAAVVCVNSVFIVRLLGVLRLPSERFVHIAPQAYPAFRIALLACLAFLALVIVIDASVLFIAIAVNDASAMMLLSNAAVLAVVTVSLGVTLGLALVPEADRQTENAVQPTAGLLDEDRIVFSKLDALMAETSMFQDPEVTVARLGRRLGVPARSVSSAVNRMTGENTSRYINGFRVRLAVELLETTELSITDIMLETGFFSKSSFNSEFRRITGTTPSDYRKQRERQQGVVRKQVSERSTS